MTLLCTGTAPAAAQTTPSSDDPLAVVVAVAGQDITDRTVTLDPVRAVDLDLTITNTGSTTRSVRLVRVSGEALALDFFTFDTTLPFTVPPRSQVTRSFPLDVRDLDGQAIGLLPTSVELLTEDRVALGSAETVVDVRGSLWSVYGAFGIAMLALAVVLWSSTLVALARHRLPGNRFRRALRFLPAGVATGLVAVVSLSVLRLVAPEPEVEIPLVLGAAVVAMLLGFFTPHPAGPATVREDATAALPRPVP
ncbi:hypothetical protein [Actinokineospora pegani]|uniref:hypothetical protein n=1 Tax=Actinokineospora pegani TaxID=2654637 RepID=UPI002E252F64